MFSRARFVPDLTPDDISEYERLCGRRRELNRRIRELLEDAPLVERPTWGPCTRCGGVWKGKWPQRKPRCCAKCGNLYWDQPYSSPEAEKVAVAGKEERRRQRDPRFLTERAKKNELDKALEILHKHGLTVPTVVPPKSNGRSGLTPPPPPVAPEVFTLPARRELPQPERELVSVARRSGVTAAPAASPTSASVVGAQEIGDRNFKEDTNAEATEQVASVPVREPEVSEEAGGDVPEAAGCCSRPLVVDGACLNCRAGLERKVTIDVNDER